MQGIQSYADRGRLAWVMTLVAILTVPAAAENWPRFRGPNGQGISETKGIPTKWSEQDYAWKITLPGVGHACPVVWHDNVFITCADKGAKRGVLLCLNTTDGAERWRCERDLTKYPINSLNSYASSTPAVDADHVYVLWPSKERTVLAALKHDGTEAWTTEFSGVQARHGKGSSPIVAGDYVVVSHEQEGNNEAIESQWLAVARRTGGIKWRRSEPAVAAASYSTPCVWTDGDGRMQVVFASNAHGVTGVDLETGETQWELDSVLAKRVVSSPLWTGELIVATCGEGGQGSRLTAIRPAGGGPATEVYSLETRVVPYVPTSVAYGEHLFLFHDNGTVTCVVTRDGKVLWSEKPAGRFYGSPVCVNGVLYAMTTSGDVVVLKAGPTYELLAVNPLGEKSHATPAVGDGRMFLRTESHLIAIGGGRQ